MFRRRRIAYVAVAAVALALVAFGIKVLIFPSPSALASTTTLSIIQGTVLVQEKDAETARPGVDGEILHAGDRVVTQSESRAVITFFDGSTQELEPGTDVTIQSLGGGDGGGFFARIKQEAGTTWNSVMELLDPDSGYEVETPAAAGTVRDTLFQVTAYRAGVPAHPAGTTTFRSMLGTVTVAAEATEVAAGTGTQTMIVPGEPPRPS